MLNKKIKILLYSDSVSASTGFGVVSHNIVKRLLKTNKYEIHQLAINWYGDSIEEHKWENLYLYPMQSDPYGRNRVFPLLMKVQPDILLAINDYDSWGHIPEALQLYKEKTGKSVKWLAHSPIDGEPIYPEWIEFIKRFIDKFVVVSKYGQEVISKTDPTFSVDQIYHGVDTEVFKKLPEKDIKKAKEQLQGKFCIVMVGTNQLRKQYPIALEAFTNFAKDKDDVVLLLHTQRNMSVGWNLDKLVRLFNISNKVLFTSGLTGLEGIKREELNLIYNIADVFLNNSCGEGFALPLLESMFAGAPVIYAANSSLPELIGDAGIPIPTDHYTIFPNRDRELVRPIPSSQVITEALNKLYNDRNLLKEYSQKSLDRTKELYDSGQLNWDVISDYFDKEFDKLLENKEEVLSLEEVL